MASNHNKKRTQNVIRRKLEEAARAAEQVAFAVLEYNQGEQKEK